MQELLLNDDLMEWVSQGKKHGTSRLRRRDIQLGPLKLKATNGTVPDIEVKVKSVMYCRLTDVPREVIKSEGYDTYGQLFASLRRFYPDVQPEDEMTLIEWSNK